MELYGLLITKDDHAIFEEWCCDQLPHYNAVVCLDGSETDATERLARRFADRLVYLHEDDCRIASKTDHGLRAVVHEEIVRRFGLDNWVMCCHADEFCYHDPRKVVLEAARGGFDLVSWYSLHFLPHPDDLPGWDARRHLSVRQRVRHYHWGHAGTGLPWKEDRLYHNGSRVCWDGHTSGSVRPHGLKGLAPFHPVLLHYKVYDTDLSRYEPAGPSTFYRGRWAGGARTGLPFPVRQVEDLFVSALPRYAFCDRFEGRLDQPWNMGEEYRPDGDVLGSAAAPAAPEGGAA